jgi:AcrR family transcriptional regulator
LSEYSIIEVFMARPRSGDKRDAILHAAVQLFAARGVGSTPTSAISTAAKIAEGTLFTYFSTKEELVNEVYRLLKREIADALLSAYPKAADARVRFRHIWDRYVHWGVTHPAEYRVLEQLQASAAVTADSRAIAAAGLKEIERLGKDSIRKKRIRNLPLPYLAATLGTLAETTIGFVSLNRNSRIDYASVGFEIFWAGISL